MTNPAAKPNIVPVMILASNPIEKANSYQKITYSTTVTAIMPMP